MRDKKSGKEAYKWTKGSEHKACRSLFPDTNAHQGGGTQQAGE